MKTEDPTSPMDSSSHQPDAVQPDPTNQPEVQPSRSRKWIWALLSIAVLLGGTAAWRFFVPGQASKPATAQQAPPPRPVEVAALTGGEAVRRVELIGQVEARQQAVIRAQTDGVIQEVLVQPGDQVTAGMTIAVLENTDQQLAVSEAKARLAQQRSNLARLEVSTRPEIIAQRRASVKAAQAREQEAQDNLKRTSELVREGALSQRLLVEAQSALDAAKGERLEAEAALAEAVAGPIREEIAAQQANVEAAQAAVNQAAVNLRRTRITALSDGVVQSRQASPGDYVESADPVLTLVSSDSLDVFLELPENLSSQVKPGQVVELSARALPNWKGRAQITGVVPAADAASRRSRARVRLDNPPSGLIAGMAVQGVLAMQANTPSFEVSRDALTRRQNQWLLFSVADGKVQQHQVEMVADMGQTVAVYNPDLREGLQVVVKGSDGLKEGAAVKIFEPK
jgi:HlyD family secretion protein